jgi:hypothetical protein
MNSFFVKFQQQKITIFYPKNWVLKKITSKCYTRDYWVARVFHVANEPAIVYMDLQFKPISEDIFSYVRDNRLVNIENSVSSVIYSEVFELEKGIAYYTFYYSDTPNELAFVIFKKLSDNILATVLFDGPGPTEKQLEQGLLLVNNMKLG